MSTATRPLMDTQGIRLQSFLNVCPGIYVGHAVRSHLLIEAVAGTRVPVLLGVSYHPRTGREFSLSLLGHLV